MANANLEGWGSVAQVTQEQKREVNFFVYSVVKFLCQVLHKFICPDILDALDEYDLSVSPRLTDNIKRAIQNYITKRPNIMEFHSNETWKEYLESNESTLSDYYEEKIYLEYLSLNGYEKIIRSSENDNYASQITFYNTAMNILLQGFKSGLFTDESWSSLDEAASKSIDELQTRLDMEIDR